MAQGIEVWKSMITESMMEVESKEYNARSMKTILSGILDPIKAKVEKCSLTKGMWDKLQDLHSKGALPMISNQEGDGKKEGNLELIKEDEKGMKK